MFDVKSVLTLRDAIKKLNSRKEFDSKGYPVTFDLDGTKVYTHLFKESLKEHLADQIIEGLDKGEVVFLGNNKGLSYEEVHQKRIALENECSDLKKILGTQEMGGDDSAPDVKSLIPTIDKASLHEVPAEQYLFKLREYQNAISHLMRCGPRVKYYNEGHFVNTFLGFVTEYNRIVSHYGLEVDAEKLIDIYERHYFEKMVIKETGTGVPIVGTNGGYRFTGALTEDVLFSALLNDRIFLAKALGFTKGVDVEWVNSTVKKMVNMKRNIKSLEDFLTERMVTDHWVNALFEDIFCGYNLDLPNKERYIDFLLVLSDVNKS